MKVSNIKIVPNEINHTVTHKQNRVTSLNNSYWGATVIFEKNVWYAKTKRGTYPIRTIDLLPLTPTIYSLPTCNHLENYTAIYMYKLDDRRSRYEQQLHCYSNIDKYCAVKPDLPIIGNIIDGQFYITHYGGKTR